MKTLIIIGVVLLLYIVWQMIELRFFKITEYEITSPKVSREYKMAVVADLHGFRYGKANRRLLNAIYAKEIDALLIPGDMIVSKKAKTYETALDFFRKMGTSAPMYYSYGNHEHRVSLKTSPYHAQYAEYEESLAQLPVHLLKNETKQLSDEVAVTGLTIPLSCYEKGKSVPLPAHFLEENLPKAETGSGAAATNGAFRILLAHNPAYAEEYAAWGADLTVCGHNHGGLIRIPGKGSLISPQFQWFPKYDAGMHDFDGRKAVISCGLGTHTFHIRIFNRAELVVIRIKPQDIAENIQK